MQLAEADVAAHVPAAQDVQLADAAVAHDPAVHAVQPAAPAVPAFVTAPANPGAHTPQAATDALPVADPAVQMPAGHAVQAPVAPAAAE